MDKYVQVGIPLETGQKQYSVDYKLQTYLKIARLYLEDDDPIQAEASINRATLLQTETQNEELQILYKFCYARVLGNIPFLYFQRNVVLELSTFISRHECCNRI